MPSASVKVDHHGSQETLDPIQKILSLVDKKIRNLEKRKNKLDGYRTDLKNGKTLIEDQQQAVEAYDSVCASLELTREFSGQFLQVQSDNNKLVKKQMRKDQQEKTQEELERVKEILKIQAVLQRMGSADIRTDFLAGNNGAVKLTNDNLTQLDQIYKLVTPTYDEIPESSSFEDIVSTSAEHLVNLVEGKPKTVSSTTYKEVRKILQEIALCPYPESTEETDSTANNVLKEEKPVEYANGAEEEVTTDKNDSLPSRESFQEISQEDSSMLSSQNPPMLSQIPPPESAAQSTPLPDNILDRVTASDGPPPGLVPPSVSPVPQDATQQDPLVTDMSHLNVSNQPPPAPNVPPPSQSFFSQNATPLNKILRDLVTPGDFDFLQENQVQDPPNMYIDPAVVSHGAVEPESLVQLHNQQAHKILQLQQNSLGADSTQMSNISAQNNYNNQSYQAMSSTNYSQNLSYSSNVSDLNANPSQSHESKIGFTTESSSNWGEQEESQPVPAEESNWGVNGDIEPETKWTTDNDHTLQNSSWASEEYDDKMGSNSNQNDFDRRSGFNSNRNNNRGNSRGNNRGYRGGRGNNYGGYQNGGRGGNFGGNYRNGRTNNVGGSGFRGSRGGSRGGGNGSGSSRNNVFRGNQGGGRFQRPFHSQASQQ